MSSSSAASAALPGGTWLHLRLVAMASEYYAYWHYHAPAGEGHGDPGGEHARLLLAEAVQVFSRWPNGERNAFLTAAEEYDSAATDAFCEAAAATRL